MVVEFEFLDSEPIKNVITCLNFEVNKTVFFGYAKDIEMQRENLSKFLTKYCDVQVVDFIKVPRGMLQETIEIMREAVLKEKSEGNQVFFDVTGGETLPLVAFGILSVETETSMHIYNVERNKLRELEEGAHSEISRSLTRREIPLTVEMLIELRGGAVIEESTKANKRLDDPKNIRDINRLISVFNNFAGIWTRLTTAIKLSLCDDGEGVYHIDYDIVLDHYYDRLAGTIKKLLHNLADIGLIHFFSDEEKENRFSFESEFVKDNILESGAVLELMTCLKLREQCGIAQAGVHVDWNGIQGEEVDVINEVDVIAIDEYTPIIVSCKCGNQANKEALYELETVANRFGGEFARKILVSAKNMTAADRKRAKEMGIEIEILDFSKKVKNYSN